MSKKAKVLISVRLSAEDAKFIADHIPKRRRSEFIQRAVANGVVGIKAIRGAGSYITPMGFTSTPAKPVYTSSMRWIAALDLYANTY